MREDGAIFLKKNLKEGKKDSVRREVTRVSDVRDEADKRLNREEDKKG